MSTKGEVARKNDIVEYGTAHNEYLVCSQCKLRDCKDWSSLCELRKYPGQGRGKPRDFSALHQKAVTA